jgi:hypothetical protein
VEVGEGVGLDGTANVDYFFFELLGKVRDEDVADRVFCGLIQNQSESAIGIVVADQDDRAMKNGAAQLAAIEQQLSPERGKWLGHAAKFARGLRR